MATSQEIEGRVFGGDFEVRRLLDEGAFAAVYLCRQQSLSRDVVLKVLHRRFRRHDLYVGRFLREAKLAARLDHPYAAHVYRYSEAPEDGVLWIAMERVSGKTLKDWLEAHGPMPLDQFVPFFERVAEVVHAAHGKGIIHRDLKPSNIMVIDRAGRLLPKLLDFGLGKLLDAPDEQQDISLDRTPPEDALHALTHLGAMVGTPPYMPPEQWTDPRAVGPLSDLYALAVVAYQALTGRLPFFAGNAAEYLHLHHQAPVPLVGEGLPVALDRFFERALAKVPEQRWGSALDLSAALRIAASGGAGPLPQLDPAVRDEWLTRAPQPLAAGIADLCAATNAHHARDAVHELACGLLRYLLVLALSSRHPDQAQDDPELLELLRAVRTREVAIEERVRLLRLLVRGREKLEVPELLELVTPVTDGADQLEPFLALGSSDYAASEDVARLRLEGLIQQLTAALAACAFLLEYEIVCADGTAVESWRGARPGPAAPLSATHLAAGRPKLVDGAGRARLDLWPAIQVLPVADAGVERELCVFDGKVGDAARMISSSGRPLSDPRAWRWITQLVADLENRTRLQEQLRSSAGHWDHSARPRKLLLRRQALRDLEPLMTSPLLNTEPVKSFISESRRDARRVLWIAVTVAALFTALVALAFAYAALVRLHESGEIAEKVQTETAAEQGRQELLHDEPAEALTHLSEAYRRGDRSPGTRFMLSRTLQPMLAEQVRIQSSSGRMWSAIYSPDHRQFVTTDDRNAQVLDAETHEPLFTLPHGGTVFQAVYTPDGSRIVTASGDGTVRVWSARDGALLRVLDQAQDTNKKTRYYAVAVSPDCEFVAAIDARADVTRVWKLSTGALLAVINGDGAQFPLLAFSPDGRWLAVGGGQRLQLFETHGWSSVLQLGDRVRTLSFDPLHPRLATGSASGDASVWSIPDGARLQLLRVAGAPVGRVAYAPHGERLAVASDDGSLVIWDAAGHLHAQMNDLHDKILAVEFDPTAQRVLASSASGVIVVFDADLGLALTTLRGPANPIRTAHFDGTYLRILGSSWDGTARIWDASPAYRISASAPISDDCDTATLPAPEQRFVAIGCPGHRTQIWDTAHDRLLTTLPSVLPPTGALAQPYPAVAVDGSLAAIAQGTEVQLYSLPGGQLVRTTSHGAPVTSIAFSRAGHDLLSGDAAGTVVVTRDTAEHQLTSGNAALDVVGYLGDRIVTVDITGHIRVLDTRGTRIAELTSPARVAALRQSPNGDRLVTIPRAAESKLAPSLWDTEHYRKVADLEGHVVGRTFSARFTADGGTIITAGGDGAVRTWDGRSGTALKEYRGGTRFLADAVMVPDGSMIVAGGGDGLLRFWDVGGRLLWQMRAHRTFVVSVHFEGNDIVTRGFGGDIARWRLPQPDAVIASCLPQEALRSAGATAVSWGDEKAGSP